MFESDYGELDSAYNAILRLISHMKSLWLTLGQCSDENPICLHQLKNDIDSLKWMLEDAEKKWRPIESKIARSVANLHLETPENCNTWSRQSLQIGWRALSGISVQFKLRGETESAVARMIPWCKPLSVFQDANTWNNRVQKEFMSEFETRVCDSAAGDESGFETKSRFTSNSSTTFSLNMQSPLSRYVVFLQSISSILQHRLERDELAIKILSTSPALPLAIRRAEDWYWNRRDGVRFATSRVWTRRDEKELAFRSGKSWEWQPQRRASRLLNSGILTRSDLLFRESLNEARNDGTASSLSPLLTKSNQLFSEICDTAVQISNGDIRIENSKFFDVGNALSEVIYELMKFTRMQEVLEWTPSPDDRLRIAMDCVLAEWAVAENKSKALGDWIDDPKGDPPEMPPGRLSDAVKDYVYLRSRTHDGERIGQPSSTLNPLQRGYTGTATEKVIVAVRKLISDWDGTNWKAVRHFLRIARPELSSEELDSWTIDDVHAAFAIGQQKMTLAVGGIVNTTEAIITKPEVAVMDLGVGNRMDEKNQVANFDDFGVELNSQIKSLPASWRNAYLAGVEAETRTNQKLSDKQAWKYLKEHGMESMEDYKLPKEKTFCDYRSKALCQLGLRRNQPRGGRKGRSVVEESDL